MSSATDSAAMINQADFENALNVARSRPLSDNFTPQLPSEKISSLMAATSPEINPEASEQGSSIIHYTSAYSSESAEMIAFEVAHNAALENKQVLFIDCSQKPTSFFKNLKNQNSISFYKYLSQPTADTTPFTLFDGTSLFYAKAGFHGDGKNGGFPLDAKLTDSLFTKLRHVFDLIIIYSDNALDRGILPIFASKVQNNIIIVEAERTRVPVLQLMKDGIESRGGKISGVVLNNRRFYTPRWLYALLFR